MTFSSTTSSAYFLSEQRGLTFRMPEIVHDSSFASLGSDRKVLVMINSASMTALLATSLWSCFDVKICADGGANRLYDGISPGQIKQFHPDVIIGDLDSVRPDVCDDFSMAGTIVIQDKDQESNDLDKALKYISDTVAPGPECNRTTVVILGAYGSRFDQEMANVHTLYRWTRSFERIVLLSETNFTELLISDCLHRMPITETSLMMARSSCGLLPLARKVNSITTSGLVWNLCGESLEMGQRISSSNSIAEGAGEVTVRCSEDLLWTSEIKFLENVSYCQFVNSNRK